MIEDMDEASDILNPWGRKPSTAGFAVSSGGGGDCGPVVDARNGPVQDVNSNNLNAVVGTGREYIVPREERKNIGCFDFQNASSTTNYNFADHRPVLSFKMTPSLGVQVSQQSLAPVVSLDTFREPSSLEFQFREEDGVVMDQSGCKITSIEDYENFRMKKWSHLKNLVKNNGLIPADDGRIVIVAFAGLIADLLKFPIHNPGGGLKVLASCEKGRIFYLRKERNKHTSEPLKKSERYFEPRQKPSTGSRDQLLVKKAVTNQQGSMDEREKDFSITEVTFGDFVLILLSEVDAVDDDGNRIKVAAKVNIDKLIDLWAHSVVSGFSNIVFGSVDQQESSLKVKNFSILLTDPESIDAKLKVLPNFFYRHEYKRNNFQGSTMKCINFLDQVLTFITDQVAGKEDGCTINVRSGYDGKVIYECFPQHK